MMKESWPEYLGRKTADGLFVVFMYYLLKWMGVIVVVTVTQ